MIRLEDVSVVYPGGMRALDRVSLEVPEGRCMVLVGSSGSGKTTALRLVNRLLSPTSGRVLIKGRDAAALDPIELRRRIGYAIQDVGLIPHMTVAENVGIVPRLLGWPPERVHEAVRGRLALAQLDFGRFAHRFPASLSGGQKQRVGIARALAADPEILLMDEPFGALDAVLREEIQDEFLGIVRKLHKTVLFVTHDMLEAVQLGDRVAVFKDGRVVQEGPPREIVLDPATEFVERLLGRRRALLAELVAGPA